MRHNSNRTRHLELLKRSESFENLGKVFHREEFEKFSELCKSNGAISEYIQWKNRFQLASLMEEFLNRKITVEEFIDNFFLVLKKINKTTSQLILDLDSEKFEDFNPDFLRFIGFGNLTTFIILECEEVEDYESKEFYHAIKKLFLQFQGVLEKTKVYT
jgi:hypothetical protein